MQSEAHIQLAKKLEGAVEPGPGSFSETFIGRLIANLAGRTRNSWRTLLVGVPYIWLLLFFAIPFVIVLKISLAESIVARPPYTALFEWTEDAELKMRLVVQNFIFLTEDSLYWYGYLNSLKIALISTILCLLLGYPMAYGIARSSHTWRKILLLLVILPFWTSFLLRIYAWMGLLNKQGVINSVLVWFGIVDEPIGMMNTDFAVYIGIVYSYLPFMILPLYANLERLDLSLLEAAMDLGSRPWRVFVDVTLPMSKSGIIAGSLLVFIPATGEYVIPALLGSPSNPMIGRILWDEFFSNRDWAVASAVAIVLLVFLVAPIMFFQHLQAREEN